MNARWSMEKKVTLHINWKNMLLIWNRWYKNLWDEIILLWLVRNLLDQGKRCSIVSIDPDWLQQFFAQFDLDHERIVYLMESPKGVRSFLRYMRRWSRRELSVRRQSDGVIVWWWEIMTEESWAWYWYRFFSLLPMVGKHFSLSLMGWIQPPQKRVNKLFRSRWKKRVDHVYVRALEDVSVLEVDGRKNVSWYMDTSYEALDRSVYASEEKTNTIVMNVSHLGEKYIDDIVERVLARSDEHTRYFFLPMSRESWDDDRPYREIFREKLWRDVGELDREVDLAWVMKTLASAQYIVWTRLHCYLLSYFVWWDVEWLPYQRKVAKMQRTIKEAGF